jgi:hypothetical protein
MVQRRTASLEHSTCPRGQPRHLPFDANSRWRRVLFFGASGESSHMLRAVGVLTLLVVLLQSGSPDGTAHSSGGPDVFGYSVPREDARNEPEASPIVPLSGDEPSLGPWQLIGTLPEPRAGFGAVVWGDYMYIFGGVDKSVIRAHIDASGRLGPWQSMTSMWYLKYGFGTAVSGNNIYILGGFVEVHYPLKDVERTAIQSDGTLRGWEPVNSMSTQRPMSSAVVVGNYLYALGGEDIYADGPMRSVERAAINPDGSLGSWQAAAYMTTGREGPGVVAVNGYIYAIGGVGRDTAGHLYSLNSVERAQVNPDGSLGPWQFVTPLMLPRRGLAAIASDSYIYAIGGHNGLNDNPSYTSVERTFVNQDGSLGRWQFTDAMVVPRVAHTAVMWNGHLYAIGGISPLPDVASIEGTNIGPAVVSLPFVVK